MIRSSDEIVKPLLTEDGALDLEDIPAAIEALVEELQKPAAKQPSGMQYLHMLQDFTVGAVGMLTQQVGGLMAEVGHLANAVTQAVDPQASFSNDPQAEAEQAVNLMLSSMELDRLRRLVDLMHKLNKPTLEVPR